MQECAKSSAMPLQLLPDLWVCSFAFPYRLLSSSGSASVPGWHGTGRCLRTYCKSLHRCTVIDYHYH